LVPDPDGKETSLSVLRTEADSGKETSLYKAQRTHVGWGKQDIGRGLISVAIPVLQQQQHTVSAGKQDTGRGLAIPVLQVLNLLALLVQKYKH
jgi:hypothetical protein